MTRRQEKRLRSQYIHKQMGGGLFIPRIKDGNKLSAGTRLKFWMKISEFGR